jgi:hypothetical protein
MAKVSPQLEQSFRWYLSLAAAAWTMLPACQAVWAADNQPVTVYTHAGHLGLEAYPPGAYPTFDPSCEPSFRGGNCHNCCLDLWQNYCAQRVDWHCYGGHGGLLGLGHFGHSCHAHCTSCSVGHGASGCACASGRCNGHCNAPGGGAGPVVQPQAPPADGSQPWNNGPMQQPPANPLPSDAPPAPPEPSAATGAAVRVQTAHSSPLPPVMSFSVHPSSYAVPAKSTAARSNAGTTRLLQQLNSN